MADIDSALPIRSVADGNDERVHVKIVDYTDPDTAGNQVAVSEGKAHARSHGSDSDGDDQEVLLSQEGHTQSNGQYDATNNKRPSSQGLIASERSAAPDETTMTQRATAIAGEDDTVNLDVAIKHSNGDRIDANNPLPVYNADNPGAEVEDPSVSSAVAKDATSNHDYPVTASTELRKVSAECSASGLAKFELLIEDGVGAGTYTRMDTKFNSAANPNVVLGVKIPAPVAAGVNVRVAKTNLDNQAQDLYSTINGVEVSV